MALGQDVLNTTALVACGGAFVWGATVLKIAMPAASWRQWRP
jgi:hypothetical protein